MNTDYYKRHTKGPWEWYEFADGDWILCPLWEDVIATDDWYVDAKTGEHIESHDAIWNWDDAILSLQSNCLTGNDMRCVSSTHRFGKNYTDQRLIAAAPELLADNKQLRKNIEGYIAIWDYLDPKGYAWQEEKFVALLKEHGFDTGVDA